MAKLYFKYGAMGSGKTASLLQTAYNYEEKGMKVLLFKPDIDSKGDDSVESRIGLSRKVDAKIKASDSVIEIINYFEKPDVIIIDEAQFLNRDQIDELFYYTKEEDVPVLCYGLRCDFKLDGFEGATRLLEIAEELEEIKAICECGKKATINMRLVNNIPTFTGDQVVIDGSSDDISYTGICGSCYTRMRKKY